MSFASAERAKLRDLLLEVGPNAPTLCEGWMTRDMAVHLWLRERRPDAMAGMFFNPLAGHLNDLTRKQKNRPYEAVVREWASGPGRFSPVRLIDAPLNTVEHFIHHEDVRRGGGEVNPRDFSQRVNELLWGYCGRIAPMMLRRSARPVVLEGRGMRPIVAADKRGVVEKGDAVVRVQGDPGEILLWCYGRSAVEVTVSGNEADVVKSSL
ncbi:MULTISPECIES: TIGR03085 family metal-binding protein [unclassified Corynebacterium]|uniref:TIGR03085 family metal-binding protein n=1 Tax=unclassified Corynebacterium TaxID=2624378 RepID=UPI0029CA1AD3|nr:MULTISPECIES: TIGR03085 family metal-binding protein [unclassified Corynebacterium]WPF65277.1 TIGR03085 family metal-binding protein [Corynebacterium sp. 22KM0430]WPF67772.1 TIGR03085 family metal-binding protein [Corynebacterium sp. 21KM1197]